MDRYAGQIFNNPDWRAQQFNGNFRTPFNTNSRSGPGTLFNGNNQFGQVSAMRTKTQDVFPGATKNRQVRNPTERARNRTERNPRVGPAQ